MEQLALSNIEVPSPTGQFTFALNHHGMVSTSNAGRPNLWRERQDNVGLCILVSAPPDRKPNDVEYLQRVMEIPFLPQLLDPKGPLWFQQTRNFTVVTNWLNNAMRVSRGEAGAGIGLFQLKDGKWESTIWPYFTLFENCFNLEKIASNCGDCVNNGVECIQYCVQSMWAEQNIEPFELPIESDRDAVIDLLEPEEVVALCRRVSKHSPWEFAHPRDTTGHPFSPTLVQMEEVFFSEASENRKEREERAKKAAATRRAVKRCKAECVFEPHCELCTQPYWGRPTTCQEGEYDMTVGGPYTQEQFDDAYERYWHGLPHIDRKKVERIAFNAGLTTWVFGYELVLSRMTADMDAVEFVRPRTGEVRVVDYEEAVMLCTTPYRASSNSRYEQPEKIYLSTSHFWEEDIPPMPDTLFYTYLELCANSCTLQGGRGFSNDYPLIHTVEWRQSHIHFDTNKYWCSGMVSDVFGFTLRYSRHMFPKIAKRIRSKEEVEKAALETSRSTQL